MCVLIGEGVFDHAAPGWERRRHAEAKKGESGLCKNNARRVLSNRNDDRAKYIRQKMFPQNGCLSNARRFSRLDILLLPKSQPWAAKNPQNPRPSHNTQGKY